jgi:hypothetical protein
MFVLSSSWVACIRGPEDGSDKRPWEVPMPQCVCVCRPITDTTFVEKFT